MPARTPLYAFHRAHGRLIEFGGFEMPVWYRGLVEEHLAVRERVGVFDVSHMGRFELRGTDASRFLDGVVTGKVGEVGVGRALYTLLCHDAGGIVDDVIGMRLGEMQWWLVVNAGNRGKDWAWLTERASGLAVELLDRSASVALLAVQGPRAEGVLQPLVDGSLRKLRRFRLAAMRLRGVEVVVSRTGYTGEDGFEVFVPGVSPSEPHGVERVWKGLLEVGVVPCGLGARDTLRLEAGYCLYGQDIDEQTTPWEAGLEWVVAMEKGPFVGKMALAAQQAHGVRRRRVGLVMEDAAVPRPGYAIVADGRAVGQVTSGSWSPLLRRGIAMGYVPTGMAVAGQRLGVEVRGVVHPAVVKTPPFYDPQRYGARRRP